jgi:anti-anti-sigma regulatory factor
MDQQRPIRMTCSAEGAEAVIRIEGALDARSAPDLERLIECLPTDRPRFLDLSGLTQIDAPGRDAIVRAARAGVQVRGGSVYIRRLLEEAMS